jgi:predicted amidophosphoribosyltransferase
MSKRTKTKQDFCSECGAELRLRPASCPLCGADTSDKSWAVPVENADEYQTNVRELHEQLRKLRNDDAAAV